VALELARSRRRYKGGHWLSCRLRHCAGSGCKKYSRKILICNGVQDPIVPLEQRIAFEQEMEAGASTGN